MKMNVGGTDRAIRIVIGLLLISQVFFGLHTLWGWIGVIPLLTGILGYCGAYTLIGINTCPMKRNP